MADAALLARSPLAAVLVAGRHGEPAGPAGVTLQEIVPGGVASVAARSVGLGLGLPGPGRWADSEIGRAVWLGPERWLVIGDHDLETELRERLGDAASVTDQTDARCIIRVHGPRARDMLAKGVTLDLHPRAFQPGRAAGTLVAHTTIQLWQLDDAPTFDLAVARGYAADFAEFLLSAAAEFGVEVIAA